MSGLAGIGLAQGKESFVLSENTRPSIDLRPGDYYQASAGVATQYARAIGATDVDVLVIGGGYAGLATAVGLAERGLHEVALIEAEHVGFGASGRNGGFVFAGYSLGEAALLSRLGVEHARRLYARTNRAVSLVRGRIAQNQIDCDLVDEGVIWANWFRDPEMLNARKRLLSEKFDVHWDTIEADQLRGLLNTTRYHGGLWERDALHLHPLKWARGLAAAATTKGVRIYEHSAAARIARSGVGWRVETASGAVLNAREVVLCCGGYLAGLRREIDRSVLPIATYVTATEPLGERLQSAFASTRAAVYDTRFAFDYYRPLADTRLLWGGRISILDRSPAAVARLLRHDLLRVYPQLEGVQIEFAWSGLMSYARHEMPQVGQLEPGLWFAQAFGGHGLATTIAAGETLAAAIAEGDNGWRDFAPFGLPWAGKPMGFVAAQLTYSWAQLRDAWNARK
jgi:gamma-glutamylputrescine oxidase